MLDQLFWTFPFFIYQPVTLLCVCWLLIEFKNFPQYDSDSMDPLPCTSALIIIKKAENCLHFITNLITDIKTASQNVCSKTCCFWCLSNILSFFFVSKYLPTFKQQQEKQRKMKEKKYSNFNCLGIMLWHYTLIIFKCVIKGVYTPHTQFLCIPIGQDVAMGYFCTCERLMLQHKMGALLTKATLIFCVRR